ncbi:MAG: hypothetical protein HQL56_12210 [Magnetococcales bacterium]|nr:hypothetical protein [Magnetococcales bacterium]
MRPALFTLNAESSFHGRVTVILLAANLFVWGLAGWSLLESRQQYREEAEVTTRNLASVLEHAIAGVLDKIDIALVAVVSEVERQLAAGSLDGSALGRHMARIQATIPEITSLRVTDAEGNVRYGNEVTASTRINLADRSFFTRQRDEPASGLVIAEPVLARISKTWVVPLSRRINGAGGTFAGVAYINIPLDYLAQTFSRPAIGHDGLIALREATNLGLVFRYPKPRDIAGHLGDPRLPAVYRQRVEAGVAGGTFTASGDPDGVERTTSFRRVARHPFIISVGLSITTLLAEWWQQAWAMGLQVSLFGFFTLVAGSMLHQAWRRQTEAALRFEREAAERRLREEELRRLNQKLDQLVTERTVELRAANRELQTASHAAAHNLRAPLRALNGFSAALLEEAGDRLNAGEKEFLQLALQSAGEMEQCVEGFLRLVRATSEGLSRQNVDLSTLAESILADCRGRDAQRVLVSEVTPGMSVSGDPHLLAVALGCLLDNAWKFSAGRPVSHITFTCAVEAGQTTYCLRDNGVGFDMAHVERLFLPFQRAHRAGEFPGTGVGLAIAQRIIARHGGRIRAESTPGQGALFLFTLTPGERHHEPSD